MKHKLESRLQEEETAHEDDREREEEDQQPGVAGGIARLGLKVQHSENVDHGIWSHHFMGNRWGNSGNSVRLYFLGLQNHCRW